MNKTFALAALLLSACAADVEITVGPERGGEVGVEGEARVVGRVAAAGRVVLGNDSWVRATEVVDGGFAFAGVPDGTYFVKLEAAGVVSATESVVVTGGAARVQLAVAPLATGFSYHWQRDASRGGHEQGSVIGSARTELRSAYGIELSDEDLTWSDEHAARLLQTLRAVPQPVSSRWAPVAIAPTTWVLSTGRFARHADVVRVPATAFATTRFVTAELHTAIVADVTDDGRDRVAADRILIERYGVRAYLFEDAELVALISMLEDMPARLRSLAALKTIIRRPGGAPVYATVAEAYLEIGATAFEMDRAEAQHDLIREKARFVVTPEMQAAWGDVDMADAIADSVMRGDATVPGLAAEPKPISQVAISTAGRTATVELGVEASSGSIYLFNPAALGYQLVSLSPTAGGLRGSVTLSRGGAWRPDVLVIRDAQGGMTVRDVSEVGWQLEVE